MNLDEHKIKDLLIFFSEVGRTSENCEAWVHALVDIQESYFRIYEKFLPEAVASLQQSNEKKEIFWNIREELRHIEYHLNDIDGK